MKQTLLAAALLLATAPAVAQTMVLYPSQYGMYVPPNSYSQNNSLGTRFKSSVPGKVIGIRFYATLAGATTAKLWKDDGTLVATITISNATANAWNDYFFTDAATGKRVSYFIPAATYFRVSYFTSSTFKYWPAYFSTERSTEVPLVFPVGAGYYTTGASHVFPANVTPAKDAYAVEPILDPGFAGVLQ